MIKIGITGQSGFIGTHLYNTLGLYPKKFDRIPFEDEYFLDEEKLRYFVSKCDAIVHLAAMNRHSDPQLIYDTNIRLVRQLIAACESKNIRPGIIFASSTQEERDNAYGKSKKEGRKLFEEWAKKNKACFIGLVIPNVFGPFGQQYYNSVVATFCYQLTHNETPTIEVDGVLKLIYVSELITEIISYIEAMSRQQHGDGVANTVKLRHTATIKVSELLKKLAGYKAEYFEKAIFPGLDNAFARDLFNTFLCYIDHKSFFPFRLKLNSDNRGTFVETVKLNSGGQVSFSTTVPGITRGNHFHIRKAERFAVIKGKAIIELRRIGIAEKLRFELDGCQPSCVDMPIWYTHNITNVGDEELYTIFWISEQFDPDDQDTFFEKV